MLAPSDWITRFSGLIKPDHRVLDLACGGGRHGRIFLEKGCHVTFLDQNLDNLSDLTDHPNATLMQYDLEDGSDWPFGLEQFEAILVTNYLHRPLLKALSVSLKNDGVLLYETFMRGHEKIGRPQNPDFLLVPDELSSCFKPELQTVAFEQGLLSGKKVIQRICAVKTQKPVFYD